MACSAWSRRSGASSSHGRHLPAGGPRQQAAPRTSDHRDDDAGTNFWMRRLPLISTPAGAGVGTCAEAGATGGSRRTPAASTREVRGCLCIPARTCRQRSRVGGRWPTTGRRRSPTPDCDTLRRDAEASARPSSRRPSADPRHPRHALRRRLHAAGHRGPRVARSPRSRAPGCDAGQAVTPGGETERARAPRLPAARRHHRPHRDWRGKRARRTIRRQ